MSDRPQSSSDPTAIDSAAAGWLARRDRGMTPREQDEFLEWCRADPRHRAAFTRHDATWNTLNLLSEWRPADSSPPNPRLLREERPRSGRVWMSSFLGLAAALAVGLFLFSHLRGPEATRTDSTIAGLRVLPSAKSLVFEDGSVVLLNEDARVEQRFSPAERRVRLVSGEAYFKVAKNLARPFLVETPAVVVRAVGTEFSVRGGDSVEVLVTEGKVEVEMPAAASTAKTPVGKGEYAVIDVIASNPAPSVSSLSPAMLEQKLAWRSVRLEFADLPLPAVVAEFNARNREQMVIGDPAVMRVHIGGTFRADNVDGFVRLLEGSFQISAERREGGVIVLRHRE